MPVYGPGLRRKPRANSGLYAPEPPAIPIAPLQVLVPFVFRSASHAATANAVAADSLVLGDEPNIVERPRPGFSNPDEGGKVVGG